MKVNSIPNRVYRKLYEQRIYVRNGKTYSEIAKSVLETTGYFMTSNSVREFYKRHHPDEMVAEQRLERTHAVRRNLPIMKHATLCWGCANAVPSADRKTGCIWSRRFKPVPGWDAQYSPAREVGKGQWVPESYTVISCPKFVPDCDEDDLTSYVVEKEEL